MKKLLLTILKFIYGIYNIVAMLLLASLFISQRTWDVHGNKRTYRPL